MTETVYLNIGCGRAKLPGFINIDLEPDADVRCDVTQGLPYADNSVDGIYSEHFIEHLSQGDIVSFLRECRRVLKPGGRVRIATPDLDEVVRQYAQNDWQQPWLQKYGYEWIPNRAECLNVVLRDWGHQWLVNEEELSSLAAMAGLERPLRCQHNVSEHPRLANLETRIESTLIMEFTKREDSIPADPLVTIVIPAFRSDFFSECLDSALAQTHTNLEILILDDSATDEIERIVEDYLRRDPRIVYRRNTPALGEPENLTLGIRLAHGDFIKPLYDDDLLEPDAVERLIDAFRAAPDARLAAGRRLWIDAAGSPLHPTMFGPTLAETDGRLSGTAVIGRILSTGVNMLGEPTVMLFRRTDALAIDEPNVMSLFGRLCFGIGDVCLALHLLSRGDLAYVAAPIARFRQHAGQTQRQPENIDRARASWAYIRSHAKRLGIPLTPVLQPDTHKQPAETVRLRRLAVYARDVSTSACPQIRFLRPAKLLWGVVEVSWGTQELAEGSFRPLELDADLYVVTRLYPGEYTQASIEALFARGKPIIYDTDDLLTELPADNPHAVEFAPLLPYIEQMLRRAHAVTVSTPALARRLARYNDNIHVVPNYVDFDLFNRLPKPGRREVRIGLSGTGARAGDFPLVDEALRRICEEYARRVRVFFIGAMPEGWRDHPCAEHVPFVGDYRAYAARMKALDLDIGLAPLQDNAFNACKSPIKWMEYSALGMASVCSHVPAYETVVVQGKTGLLVDNKPEKWYTALKLLIDEPEYRQLLALQAQQEVLRNHSLQRQAQRWLEAYQGLYQSLIPDSSPLRAERMAAMGDTRYELWRLGHQLQSHERQWWRSRVDSWPNPPRFAIGILLPADKQALIEHSLMSLQRQLLATWELVVVAERARPAALPLDDRLIWILAAPETWLSTITEALRGRGADWVTLIEAGDTLPEHALCLIADKGLRHPEWQALYTDEDRVDAAGEHHGPYFKPALAAEWLRSAPYSLGGGLWCRAGVFARVGGYDPASLGFEHWSLALRLLERGGEAAIGRVQDVLYHRHEMGGHCQLPADAVQRAAVDSLAAHLTRQGLSADIEEGLLPGSYNIRYRVQGEPMVSILLPVRNRVDLLKPCLTTLVEQTAYRNGEILVVDVGSDDAQTLLYFNEIEALGSDRLRLLRATANLTPAARLNEAVTEARGEFLLLLSPSCVIQRADWLETLLGYVQLPQVGAVGPSLIDLQSREVRLGQIMGLKGQLAAPVRYTSQEDHGYYGLARLPHRVSSLAGECLLTPKVCFEQCGGLDTDMPSVELAVTDYCLRLAEQGYKVLCIPQVAVGLQDGATMQQALAAAKSDLSLARQVAEAAEAQIARWAGSQLPDRCYNRNLSLHEDHGIEITPPLTWDPEWRPAPRVVSIHADEMGCGEYRISAPMRALQSAGRVMGWDVGHYFTPADWLRIDPEAIVFQRQITPGQIQAMAQIARYSRAFRVFELDDLITNIPVQSSQKALFTREKDLLKRFRKAVGLCHRFIVSTDYLAEAFRGYSPDIRVVPNYLDATRWLGFTPRRRVGRRLRVGWAGSITHAGDLRVIEQVVKDTAGEVDWVFLGMCPESIRPYVAEFHEPVKLADYPAKLADLSLDLAVAPLEDVPFNHGKSHLRLLEYGIMGYPVLCSDITPYRGDYPVWRVPNRYRDWVGAIREAAAQPDTLAEAGDRLRNYVHARWMLQDHLDVWLSAWLP